ncbi:hypothetical protein GCM10011321_41670 [Youhaiella tibetensis]|uniref:Uncharacterized protein n=1 Tax=Paradevosia tibetensis TaxID=1447062 RepID=A0A5B9DR75_9HYPH|nr:hypothetical protein [Youhaiella tibetensis]QEE21931.1 hypothetical protein FNA67_17870 [Youhaiella tibetensis]GGF46930.1 hypothetical protein GCM10011321_41670 [Youhaiella tibetensis]
MKLGNELARLTAGIDKLYRSTPRSDGFLDKEGLIPVAVAEVEPAALRDYDEATDALEALLARVPGEAESDLRRAYVSEMIDSLLALVTTFAEKDISFADRVRRQIRVSTQKVDEATLDGYRAIIAEKLGEIGYGGQDLGSDVRRWEADVRVPREQVLDTMRKLTADARAKVSATMYEMGDDWLEPDEVRGVPFSAYCDYPGRKLLLNLDHPYTIYALKHLATHEAFPGHLVHLALRQRYVAEGKMPLDGAQVVTSSASSALFEGIADNGLFFIDLVETPEDELAVALQRLRGALRCNAAWMHHVEGKSIEEIAAANAEAGYMDVATTASRLGFLRHGLRAPFVYAYWCGDMAVHDVWKTVPRERRAEFWQYLYGNMHTPDTLKAFWR